MMHVWTAVAWLVAIVWIGKLLETAMGFPRVPDLNRLRYDAAVHCGPKLAVIVAARNEEDDIANCLRCLIAQDYADLQIIAIDDRSTDATAELMDVAAATAGGRLQVLHMAELAPGWLGKTRALASGAQLAMERGAEYLLFTDGDVSFKPYAIRRSLAQAIESKADHFVLMPTLLAQSIGERAVLSYIQASSLLVVRPWRVSDVRAQRDAIGVGAFNMVRAAAYRRIGGFEATPMEVLEDLYLGRRIKWAGLKQEVAIATGMVEVHWARGALGIARGMTKNMFAVFRFRPAMLLAAAAATLLFFIAPVAFALSPSTHLAGCIALASAVGMYFFASRINRISALYSVFLPAAVLLVVWAMLRSMYVTLADGGVTWRGTFYDLETLRAGMVRAPAPTRAPRSAR